MDRIITSSRDRSSLLSTQSTAQHLFSVEPDAGFIRNYRDSQYGTDAALPGLILTLVVCRLMFLTYKTANKPVGILSAFAFTGFLGYILARFLTPICQQAWAMSLAWRWVEPR